MGGEVIAGDPSARWRGAALDSRAVQEGELFFALPGERTDGHRFVGDALARGAAAAVVARDVSAGDGALIRVDDTLEALHALTRAVRRRLPARVVAVTGSTGKTTVKEMLAALLEGTFRIARSPGNLNNLYGFPLALLAIPEDTEWMVAEMGMSSAGELGAIGRLGRPDAVVYTNVRPVHLEFFGSLRAIAEAKGELLESVPEDGLMIANADDAEVERLAARFGGRVVRYGLGPAAEVRAEEIAAAAGGGSTFRLLTSRGETAVRLPVHGLYNVENFLAAAACALALGVSPSEIADRAARLAAAAMRGELHPLPGGGTLIDDSYNSNPAALERALESAAEISGGRRWAVLGEMLELGPTAPELHRRSGQVAVGLGFSPIVGVGPLARRLVEGAAAAGGEARWTADAADAAEVAAAELQPGDVVLVKGSRGVGLERVVRRLTSSGEEG
ncbi:MAG: UDP-N-acetylmuramoyl-tripeptide--D-alanyl-D-alanine ligase [Thermoanaerobaculia bacterium]|nr:UDP-N-acetylmuramoyl-tripeptide--D-alanyl-D-alanine ligase [Thermoanaerobaculia bacterium]